MRAGPDVLRRVRGRPGVPLLRLPDGRVGQDAQGVEGGHHQAEAVDERADHYYYQSTMPATSSSAKTVEAISGCC